MNIAQLAKFASDPREYAARFAERVVLAKMTRDDAIAQTAAEWDSVQKWIASDSERPGSFVHMCDTFGHEPSAVRRAIREKK